MYVCDLRESTVIVPFLIFAWRGVWNVNTVKVFIFSQKLKEANG